ncbi:DsbE family thiol:disulfide interchange protein [Polycladidibacter hongkongensis]|uniref:DsbE family thiol:disulfide interchange protein n=1 Tax=Polycladidibacter hongkongensis TaxID=1647556 RepID=UPI000834FAF9|nr:DsbE family thiol:disulfide interchange protein [Pseudovibrio hongkongensis]
MSDNNQEESKRSGGLLFLLPAVVFGALGILFAFWLVSGHDPQKLPSALLDKPAPEFVLPAVAGVEREGTAVPGFARADLIGQVSVVNVFASWCAPCRVEHPFIKQLGEDGRFQLLGLNYKDAPKNAKRFLDQLGNPYDRIGSDSGRVGIDWGVYGVPETFVVDRQGVIRYKFVGPLNPQALKDVLMPRIEDVLALESGK